MVRFNLLREGKRPAEENGMGHKAREWPGNRADAAQEWLGDLSAWQKKRLTMLGAVSLSLGAMMPIGNVILQEGARYAQAMHWEYQERVPVEMVQAGLNDIETNLYFDFTETDGERVLETQFETPEDEEEFWRVLDVLSAQPGIKGSKLVIISQAHQVSNSPELAARLRGIFGSYEIQRASVVAEKEKTDLSHPGASEREKLIALLSTGSTGGLALSLLLRRRKREAKREGVPFPPEFNAYLTLRRHVVRKGGEVDAIIKDDHITALFITNCPEVSIPRLLSPANVTCENVNELRVESEAVQDITVTASGTLKLKTAEGARLNTVKLSGMSTVDWQKPSPQEIGSLLAEDVQEITGLQSSTKISRLHTRAPFDLSVYKNIERVYINEECTLNKNPIQIGWHEVTDQEREVIEDQNGTFRAVYARGKLIAKFSKKESERGEASDERPSEEPDYDIPTVLRRGSAEEEGGSRGEDEIIIEATRDQYQYVEGRIERIPGIEAEYTASEAGATPAKSDDTLPLPLLATDGPAAEGAERPQTPTEKLIRRVVEAHESESGEIPLADIISLLGMTLSDEHKGWITDRGNLLISPYEGKCLPCGTIVNRGGEIVIPSVKYTLPNKPGVQQEVKITIPTELEADYNVHDGVLSLVFPKGQRIKLTKGFFKSANVKLLRVSPGLVHIELDGFAEAAGMSPIDIPLTSDRERERRA